MELSAMEQTTRPAALSALAGEVVERFEPRLTLNELSESPLNPRRHFDEAKLAELAASVLEHGVITPLLVRCLGINDYQLIDGARRYRAARLAGLAAVPARVIVCDDATALELATIANLQRADVHPLDEALGFQRLINQAGYEIPALAAKVGKSESYVRGRLKLVDLCERAQKLFWADEISAAVAVMLARVPVEQQGKALDVGWCLKSTKDLQSWLNTNVYLDLHQAPWKKDDPDLVPAAGACVDCPKRTGFAPALFTDIAKSDTCTDPVCFAVKRAAFVEVRKAELAAKAPDVIHVSGDYYNKAAADAGLLTRHDYQELTKAEAKDDPDAKKALIVDGDGAGRTIYVKTSKSAAAKSDTEKAAAKKAKLEDKIRRETAARSVAAIVGAVDDELTITGPFLRFVVTRMWERAWNDLRVLIMNRRGFSGDKAAKSGAMEAWIKKAQAPDLLGLLLELSIGAYGDYHQEPMKTAAGLVEVDLAAIAKATRAELVEAAKPKPKAKKAPAKKTAEKKPRKKRTPAPPEVKAAKNAARKAKGK